VIPPRCEVTLPGLSTSLVTTHTQFLFQPDQEKLQKLGIFATHTLLFPCKNFIIPLRLLNTGFAPIRLYKGTTLGHLEPDVIQISTNSTMPIANVQVPTEASQNSAQELIKNEFLNVIDFTQSDLTPEQKMQLLDLLVKNRHTFAFSDKELGTCTTLYHRIETGTNLPVSQKAYRVPVAFHQELEKQIRDLENARVIRPSRSPWAAPVILVSKKDQSMRLVVDYWKLNLVSAKDIYLLPNITTLLDSLGN
ncbi:MAG: hypothetical protein GY858_04200, partial [Candidatus Omnitrophica bacterium]|nr:hypothetical protein [Candidatus Omnitrophota bacterium]